MSAQNVKEEARRLVENLPEDVTWDGLMYQIYVRQNIEAGLADSEADRVVEVEEVRKGFGLS
jgi:predicted transcriptional regulator